MVVKMGLMAQGMHNRAYGAFSARRGNNELELADKMRYVLDAWFKNELYKQSPEQAKKRFQEVLKECQLEELVCLMDGVNSPGGEAGGAPGGSGQGRGSGGGNSERDSIQQSQQPQKFSFQPNQQGTNIINATFNNSNFAGGMSFAMPTSQPTPVSQAAGPAGRKLQLPDHHHVLQGLQRSELTGTLARPSVQTGETCASESVSKAVVSLLDRYGFDCDQKQICDTLIKKAQPSRSEYSS